MISGGFVGYALAWSLVTALWFLAHGMAAAGRRWLAAGLAALVMAALAAFVMGNAPALGLAHLFADLGAPGPR